MPTVDEVRNFLRLRQVAFQEKEIQNAVQVICPAGEEKFICYHTGKVVVGGKNTPLAQEVKAWVQSGGMVPAQPLGATGPIPGVLHRDVFIVYGHDLAARENLELVLHKMKLNPIVLANLVPGGDTIIEKLEKYLLANQNVGFACVLLTPDDEGFPQGQGDKKRYRARQNVILELGMVLARLGRQRVAILRKQSVEEPSDINGLIYLPFNERADEAAPDLYRALREAGYDPDPAGLS